METLPFMGCSVMSVRTASARETTGTMPDMVRAPCAYSAGKQAASRSVGSEGSITARPARASHEDMLGGSRTADVGDRDVWYGIKDSENGLTSLP